MNASAWSAIGLGKVRMVVKRADPLPTSGARLPVPCTTAIGRGGPAHTCQRPSRDAVALTK